MKPKKYTCPQCHAKTGVNILYGMPSYEAVIQVEHGEIALGGCCIDLDEPERQCLTCGHEWRIRRRTGPLVLQLKKLRDESCGRITMTDDDILELVSKHAR